jgi:methionyl-tRNA formyltransferase
MRFVIVGGGKAAIDIARLTATYPGAILVATMGDPSRETPQSSLAEQARGLGVPYQATRSLDDPVTLLFLEKMQPDFIISANNFLIFRPSTLAIPRMATINFHNGPLPDYAGLNPFAWAILNGERRYGISWHIVEQSIDTGAVLHIEEFTVDLEERAVGIVMKCIRAGINSFCTTLLPRLMQGDTTGVPQDAQRRHYYSAKMLPYRGYLPWWETGVALDRYIRALSFAPLPNIFFRPLIVTEHGTSVYCDEFEPGEPVVTGAGRIVSVDETGVTVSTGDGSIKCRAVYLHKVGANCQPGDIGLAPGQVLRMPVDRIMI